MLWVAYGLGVGLLLGRLAVGTVRAWRLIRRATSHGAYLSSDACAAPIAVGWVRPVVILPDRWDTWSASELDMVLSHEREHVRRRDPLVQWLALLNRALRQLERPVVEDRVEVQFGLSHLHDLGREVRVHRLEGPVRADHRSEILHETLVEGIHLDRAHPLEPFDDLLASRKPNDSRFF